MLSKISRVFLIVIALGILILSLMPKPPVGNLFSLKSLDHFLAYLVLGFFVFLSLPGSWSFFPPILITVVSCSLYGGAIELMQKLTGRKPELFDFFMNSAGACLGALIGVFTVKILSKKNS